MPEQTVTVTHPDFPEVTEQVPAAKVAEYTDQGWLEGKSPGAPDVAVGRSDLGFVTDSNANPVAPADQDDLDGSDDHTV